MSEKIQAIRGMNDVLPGQTWLWQYIETTFKDCLEQYAYQEIRFPLLESTQLFKRTIGEVTDIVEKEMYSFTDMNGESLSLRPEGTAGCIRACLEHGLLYNQQQKLWYYGPMYRHEKPQKGRYRQFFQFGVEALGFPGVSIELELIAICRRFFETLGLDKEVRLQINTLGSLEERQAYRTILIDYFKTHQDQLDGDSQKRLERSPLRILDSKNPAMQDLISKSPKLFDHLTETSKQQFLDLRKGLDALGIAYEINPNLVRGLDYYGHTVFEWVTDKLGSQATVCAGGRFDKLIEHLGGNPCSAVGFAIGAERILLLCETLNLAFPEEKKPDIFFIVDGAEAQQQALIIAERIRKEFPERKIISNCLGGSFKSQFKRADKSAARLALILGPEEIEKKSIGIKDLRQESEQQRIEQSTLNQYLQKIWQKQEKA